MDISASNRRTRPSKEGSIRNFGFLVIVAMLLSGSAIAQQAAKTTESVTVTGTKSRQAIYGFVASLAAPSRITGKLARWEDGICPTTVGLRPAFTKFISQRIRDVAAQVGAPVSSNASCASNVVVVFTKTPQVLLDSIRKTKPVLLGYHDNSAQIDRAATVTRPIQAWYTTETRDLRGETQVDTAKHTGEGALLIPCGTCGAGIHSMYLPDANGWSVTGLHLGDGMHTALFDVIIVADPTKLFEYEVGTLADYTALLALSQINSLDTCQKLPSIVNLLATGCTAKANTLTSNDIAYLKGLYKMTPGAASGVQQDEIAYQMQQSLVGK